MEAHPGPDWAAYLAAVGTALLCPSPLSLLLKGASPMQNTMKLIGALVALAGLGVVIAEDVLGPGTGPEKKARVIADIQAQAPAIAAQFGVPAVFVSVILSDALLGLLVDAVVAAAKAAGTLGTPASSAPLPA